MASTILVLSKQGHAGFRIPRYATSSFSVSLQLLRNANRFFSLSILNAASCCRPHNHHHGSCYCLTSLPRVLLLRPLYPSALLPSTASEAKRNRHGATIVGWHSSFQFQQIDRMTSCRSFASKSKSNNHNTDQPRKAKQEKGQSKYSSSGQLTVQYILDDYMQERENLEPHQVAAMWDHLKKSVQASPKWERQHFWIDHKETLKMLVDQTIQSSVQFNGRSTATVTHSLVKLLDLTNSKNLGARESFLWNALLHKTIEHIKLDGFNAHEVSNLIWAYAKADGIIEVDGRLLNAIADKAELCVDEFAPQGLSNVAWGFATLNHKAPFLFDSIASMAQVHIDDFSPQNLSNISWAFATLNHEAPSLFDTIAIAAQLCIDDFKPQELSILAWAFATLNHKAPSLFDAIARAAQDCIDDFTPQALSNMAWAFATLKHEAPFLFDAIASMAQVHIDDFSPQNLSNISWAFATLNHEAPSLFDTIARAAQVRIEDFNPQALSNMMLAYAKLNHESPDLFDAIARAAQVSIDDFTPQGLSNLAWAFAALNIKSPSLFEAIARAAQVHINDFNQQGLLNTAWSFAVFNIKANLFTRTDSPFSQMLLSTDPSIFTIEDLSQLHQFHLWCQEQNGENWLSEELGQQCLDAFVSSKVEPSRLQNEVVDSLGTLQDVSHLEEEVQTKSGYIVDAMIVYRGNEIGVEVDGPSHFVGPSQSPNGGTMLKCRQVRTLESWKLVSVPYWEWYRIDKGSNKERKDKKHRYLQNLLDEAVLGP